MVRETTPSHPPAARRSRGAAPCAGSADDFNRFPDSQTACAQYLDPKLVGEVAGDSRRTSDGAGRRFAQRWKRPLVRRQPHFLAPTFICSTQYTATLRLQVRGARLAADRLPGGESRHPVHSSAPVATTPGASTRTSKAPCATATTSPCSPKAPPPMAPHPAFPRLVAATGNRRRCAAATGRDFVI